MTTAQDITDIVDEFVSYNGPARRPRSAPVRYVLLHATRGHPDADQYRATINWFTNPPAWRKAARKVRGWGPMADFVVGADGEIAQFGDFVATRSNWSAGYGPLGSAKEWGADELSISIEMAQTWALEPMTDQCLDGAAALVARLCAFYHIPARHISFWHQRRDHPQGRGIISHDGTANGQKLGKSDPGWTAGQWDAFVARVNAKRLPVPANVPAHVHQMAPSPLRTGPPEPPPE